MWKKYRTSIMLASAIVAIVILALLYSWFNWSVLTPLSHQYSYQYIFNWPDAMANYFFIENFDSTGSFSLNEPLNNVLNDIVRPRSTNIFDHNIVPAGFLGFIILYGWLGKLLPNFTIIYLTSLIAAGGIYIFYFIIKNIFNKRIALISALITATLPAYIFFANQTLLATIPFLVSFLSGFALWIKSASCQTKEKFLLIGGSGLMFGIAVIIRYQEITWILGSILIIALFKRKKISYKQILWFSFGFIVPVLLIFFYNKQIYGHIFTVGYLRMNNLDAPITERLPGEIISGAGNNILNYLKLIFIPFGFSAANIYHNFVRYIWQPYSYLIVFIILGAMLWIKNCTKASINQLIYLITSCFLSIILCIYYGSWIFVDKMVLQNNVLSSSYTRYWLLIIIVFIPLAAYTFNFLLEKRNKFTKYNYFIVFITIPILVYLSLIQAFYAPEDGLLAQKQATLEYYVRADKVRALIDINSVLIVEREDKLFFPYYKVITFEQNYKIFEKLSSTIENQSIYYLSVATDNDIDFVNTNKLKEYKLTLSLEKNIDDKFRLFKLKKIGD